MKPFDEETVEFDGATVRISYHYDDGRDAPWDREDGHGAVCKSTHPHGYGGEKRPGDRPLNQPARGQWQYYYDWAGACKLAKKDGWNTEPYDAPNRIERAVQADFDFLRGWLNDDWRYVGVVCHVIDEEGEEIEGFEDSCWGYASYRDSHKTAGREMADELVKRYLAELDEAQYWEERDVVTA